jgi:predicted Zn-dependent protease
VKSAWRLILLLAILGALGAGLWLTGRGTAPDHRNLDAVVTVGGDLVRDAIHPAIDLTRLSSSEEVRLGKAIDAEIRARMTIADEDATSRYLQEVTDLVAGGTRRRDIRYQAAVVRSPEINAFAVAGGHIYVTEGMLGFVQNEAELAVVIGHEISHVDLRHCVERLQLEQAARKVVPDLAFLARLGYEVALRGFSEEQELAADADGALLAALASYDPWQAENLLARMLSKNAPPPPSRNPVKELALALPEALGRYLATHPPADQRMETVRRTLAARPDLWKGLPRYIGRQNLSDRVTVKERGARPEEITRLESPPR